MSFMFDTHLSTVCSSLLLFARMAHKEMEDVALCFRCGCNPLAMLFVALWLFLDSTVLQHALDFPATGPAVLNEMGLPLPNYLPAAFITFVMLAQVPRGLRVGVINDMRKSRLPVQLGSADIQLNRPVVRKAKRSTISSCEIVSHFAAELRSRHIKPHSSECSVQLQDCTSVPSTRQD